MEFQAYCNAPDSSDSGSNPERRAIPCYRSAIAGLVVNRQLNRWGIQTRDSGWVVSHAECGKVVRGPFDSRAEALFFVELLRVKCDAGAWEFGADPKKGQLKALWPVVKAAQSATHAASCRNAIPTDARVRRVMAERVGATL